MRYLNPKPNLLQRRSAAALIIAAKNPNYTSQRRESQKIARTVLKCSWSNVA